MIKINFSNQAKKDFKKLDKSLQSFINEKLKFYSRNSNILSWSKPLKNLTPATHRFRVRKYRIYFYLLKNTIFIERIILRGQAYKN